MCKQNDRVDEDSEACLSETVSSPLLVSKTKTKVYIWKYFVFETDINGCPRCVNSPKCRLCNVTVATKDSNTSNLYSHLKSKHPDEYLIAQRASNTSKRSKSTDGQAMRTLLDTWDKQQPLSTSSKEYKALTGAITLSHTRHATFVHSRQARF